MKRKVLFFLVFFLFFSGCQKLTPKLPEEKETTLKEILEEPQDFQGFEVKLTGVLTVSLSQELILKDKGREIKVSTQSSGISAEDFLNEKVEVGGALKEESGETILEMSWVGIVPREEALTVAEEKLGALAKVLEVEEEEIEIVSSEAVDWPSSALGAPEKGVMYFQVIIPGFKIIYQAEGKTYEVHTNKDGSQAVLLNPRAEL